MGRQLNTLTVDEVIGQGSRLTVTYHYRGAVAGSTMFSIADGKGQVTEFNLSAADTKKLFDYLDSELHYEKSSTHSPDYSITGYGMKIMYNGNVIRTLYNLGQLEEGVESFNYHSFLKAFPEYKKDDYYFVVYCLRDRAFSRDTIEKIIDTCVSFQSAVIISGDLRVCRPMTQLDIAELTGFDHTVISRCVKHAKIFTPYRNYSLETGISSLNFPSLFNEGITIGDHKISTLGIQMKIGALIENEDKEHPLTDEAIAAELEAIGYPIARRTVMKYRENALGIPNSNKRRIRRR